MLSRSSYSRARTAIKLLAVAGFSVTALSGCSFSSPPPNSNDICSVFQQYPRWYWDAMDAYKTWGIPISVQMAIVNQESSFRADARPPRTTLLGFIPWSRPTTAYGYAQAVNGTWAEYQQQTNNPDARRDNFADAVDFIGWYSRNTEQTLHISPRNAYSLYLAYHEGAGAYAQGSYYQKPWLMDVARNVQNNADRYRNQLLYCYKTIPKPSVWNLWLH